jgi:hypothetical protein
MSGILALRPISLVVYGRDSSLSHGAASRLPKKN